MTINPHRDIRPCAPNYVCAFQRWLQRPLSPVESSIIEPLERLRSKNAAKRRPTRLYIDTTPETAPIARDILILYIRWISSVITPNLVGHIMTPSSIEDASERFVCKADAVKADGSIQSYVTEAATESNAADGPLSRVLEKDHPRGKPIHTMLILDADQLGHSTEVTYHGYNYRRSRHRYQTFRQVLQTAGALLPPIGQSLTIILGNPTTHPRSVYARHRRRSADSLSPIFHVLTPTTAPPAPGATTSVVRLTPSTPQQPTVKPIGRDRPILPPIPPMKIVV